ncbi:hypothetical protein GGX14DRAFT_377306, partial [Mycena pura]
QPYNVWYRDPDIVMKNLLDNMDLAGAFDTAPYVELNAEGKRRLEQLHVCQFRLETCSKTFNMTPWCI